jgi:ribonucleoside-diphosphate reductase beta chain
MSKLFQKRVAFKPFEYPEIIKFKEAIQHSYWLHTEWNFIGDIHDFKTQLNDLERNAVKNAMLAISQIEVAVKKFWSKLGDRFPKAEFDQIGISFGESEIRHSDSYSHLLQVLGFNQDFELLMENPVIRGRVDYLTKYLKNSVDVNNQDYAFTLTLFSIFVENISLFSQFYIIKSFNKHRKVLKDIDNVISATMLEEITHANFGTWLINEIKKENPEWFTPEFYHKLELSCRKAYKAESEIIDWIFEQGDLQFVSREEVKEYIKNRFNNSLINIGGSAIFEVNHEILSKTSWFDEEILAERNVDFFHKKSVAYNKFSQPVTAESIFE